MQRAARLLVTRNKRRFEEAGFDLDLVYVTKTLIGMSVPAIGRTSIYRNPIDEVRQCSLSAHLQWALRGQLRC